MASLPEYYAFIDESELGDGKYVARAGFVLPSNRIERLGSEIEGILDRAGVPRHDPRTDCEIKYDPPHGNYFHGRPGRHELYRSLIGLLAPQGATTIGIVVAVERLTKWSADEARNHSLTYLLERVELCLRAAGGRGCLFLDRSSRRRNAPPATVMVTRLIREGSEYDFHFTHLRPEARELNSREWRVLQLADLVVGVTVRKVCDYIRRRTMLTAANEPPDIYAAAIWEPLRGRFMLLPGDDPKRFGLRILPSGYETGFVNAERPYA